MTVLYPISAWSSDDLIASLDVMELEDFVGILSDGSIRLLLSIVSRNW